MINRLLVIVIAMSSLSLHAQHRSELQMSKAALQPVAAADSPIPHTKDELVGDYIYRYLHFKSIPDQTQQEYLAKAGVNLYEYLGDNTYRAAVPADLPQHVLSDSKVVAQGAQGIVAKATEDVYMDLVPDYAVEGDDLKLLIHFAPEVGFDALERKLGEVSCTLVQTNGVNTVAEVSIPKAALTDLLSQPYVLGVDFVPAPAVKDDKEGRNLHRVGRLNGASGQARGYTGEGISISVRDDGAVFEHKDFEGRIDLSGVGISRGDHGDGVAGIFCGAGNVNPDIQGMAYGAFMHVQDYTSTFLDNTMSLHQNQNVLVTNSSYSDGCNRGYTFATRTVDQQLYDNPTLMHVFSAGNDGTTNCGFGAGDLWGNITGGHKMGKNVITVANLNFRGEVESSSSRGPATDGRIKPDIAANGFGHRSTGEQGSGDYMTFGGTSAAAPVVAGVTTILQDAYRSNHGEVGKAALLKTIMLNTATDLGNKGPDFIFGWGSVNAHRAALAIEQSRFQSHTISQAEQATHTISVPGNVHQVKVMVYWPDEEGVGVNRDLKMDIDARLEKDGTVYMPWVLDATPDPARLALPATKGEDHLNNMEQIAIDTPEPGEYTLVIAGTEVPFANSEYHITWEFLTNDIEVTYPNGGENLRASSGDEVHWDAAGDQGDFTIEILDANGTVLAATTANGDERMARIQFPSYTEDAIARVTRADGTSDMSDGPCVIARIPTGLESTLEGEVRTLTWSAIDEAESYNIHLLGEKYMEVVATSATNSFVIPDTEQYEFGWIAVSAVFSNGVEGQRSVATTVRNAPQVGFANLDGGDVCVNTPTQFALSEVEPQVEYNWEFGDNAFPSDAEGPGPHTVIFTENTQEVVILRATNEGGTEGNAILVDVRDEASGNDIQMEDLGTGEYIFSTNAKRVQEYEWVFGDGNTGEGATVSHIYETPGTYEVSVVASGNCGEVEIVESFNIVVVSIEELTADDFALSPNPTAGLVTLTLPDLDGETATVELYDVVGRQMTRQTVGARQRIDLQLEEYPSGVYTVMVRYGSHSIQKRLVKE